MTFSTYDVLRELAEEEGWLHRSSVPFPSATHWAFLRKKNVFLESYAHKEIIYIARKGVRFTAYGGLRRKNTAIRVKITDPESLGLLRMYLRKQDPINE